MEVFAGEKATKVYGPNDWLPDETLQLLKEYVVSIKGPLTTPVGGGATKPSTSRTRRAPVALERDEQPSEGVRNARKFATTRSDRLVGR